MPQSTSAAIRMTAGYGIRTTLAPGIDRETIEVKVSMGDS